MHKRRKILRLRKYGRLQSRGSADADLALLYKFAEDRSLASSVSYDGTDNLGPTLGIVRTTATASYWDSSGVLQNAAAGVARFDHNPVTNVSLGLLIEEGRMNIALWSEDLSGGAPVWVNFQSVDTQAQGTTPDGTNTANKLVDDGGGGSGVVSVTQAVTLATSTAYTVSVFAKADQLDWLSISISNMGALIISAFFDLTGGVVGATTGANNTSEFIEDVGNGWFKCGIVFTSDGVDTTAVVDLVVAEANNDTIVARDGSSSIFLWGAGLEVGAFPMSYIKTEASSVTRNKDEILTTDVSWNNVNAGTFLGRASQPFLDSSALLFTLHGVSDFVRCLTESSKLKLEVVNSTDTDGATLNGTAMAAGVETIMAATYADDDQRIVVDGGTAVTDSTVALPLANAPTAFYVGSTEGGNAQWNGHIAEIRYYNTRKDNQFLEDLSNGLITA